MDCPECQTKNPEAYKFCHECGAKLKSFCPKCGNENLSAAKYCGECGNAILINAESPPEKYFSPQSYTPKHIADKILTNRSTVEGERKTVTILFADVVGSTAMFEHIDPEAVHEIMDGCFQILMDQIHRYEGTVNQFRGDGLMALFGAPIAHEDHAERACHAALAIQKALTPYRRNLKEHHKIDFTMRIGLNSGPVVVGSIGDDLRMDYTAQGDTANLAARMEALAEPGSVYISKNTYGFIKGYFRFENLGQHKVKGKSEPVEVYRPIVVSSRRTRFDVNTEWSLSPFIARERELELLLDGFERIKSGRGRVFSIAAEAGMGKSRLLYELRKTVSVEDVTFWEGKCLSYNRGAAYHPIIDILKAEFDISEGDEDLRVRGKVKNKLKLLGENEDLTLPYLLELLAVKNSGIDDIPISPEARTDRIIESLKRIITEKSKTRPLVMVIEDLHWIDVSSERALMHIIESIPGTKVLLIFTYRPEYPNAWIGKSYHSQLTLNRLSERENLMMAAHILGTEEPDKDLIELILEKTEGVPFFIEEFITSCKKIGIIEKKQNKYCLISSDHQVAVPSTIQDVIMARVDTLSNEAKEILQIGAVIDREFSYELLKNIVDAAKQDLQSNLDDLMRAELIYERGLFPETTYIFRHALTQDVVYESILKRNKKKLHEKIGNAIEALYSENIVEYYGILANHYINSENYEKGAQYSELAAMRSERASAIDDAIEYTRKRIESLERLPMTDDLQKMVIDARTVLGGYLLRILKYKEAKEAIDPIADLAAESGYKKRLPEILTICGTYQMNIHENAPSAFDHLETALNVAEELKDSASLSLSSWRLGLTRALNCEFGKATRHFRKLLQNMTDINSLWGMSAANSYLSIWGYGFSGDIARTDQTSNEAVRIAEESGDIYSKSMAYTSRGFYLYLRGFLEEATVQFGEAIRCCKKIDYAIFDSVARLFLAELKHDLGDYQSSMHHHDRALSLLENYEIYNSWVAFHKLGIAMAKVMLKSERPDQRILNTYVSNNKVKLYESWKQRYMAEISLAKGSSRIVEAEIWIKKAIACDKKRGMSWYLAKDYKFLANLYKQRGDQSGTNENLLKASEIFNECGAIGWAEQCQSEFTHSN